MNIVFGIKLKIVQFCNISSSFSRLSSLGFDFLAYLDKTPQPYIEFTFCTVYLSVTLAQPYCDYTNVYCNNTSHIVFTQSSP